jgi:hypothetical protein
VGAFGPRRCGFKPSMERPDRDATTDCRREGRHQDPHLEEGALVRGNGPVRTNGPTALTNPLLELNRFVVPKRRGPDRRLSTHCGHTAMGRTIPAAQPFVPYDSSTG